MASSPRAQQVAQQGMNVFDITCCLPVLRALRNLFVTPLFSPDDTPLDRTRKTAVTGAVLIIESLTFIGLLMVNMRGMPDTLQNYLLVGSFFVLPSVYIYMRCTKRISEAIIWVVSVKIVLAVLAMDLHGASSFQMRAWPVFVVVIDMLLVCQMPDTQTLVVVGWMCCWVLLMSMEAGFRFGLFDLPGLPPEEQRRSVTECASPPCKETWWLERGIIALLVFIMDFVMTRGFARQLRSQNAALKESVDVLGHIAEHFAAYDLHSAENVLSQHRKDLPGGMVEVFEELLANLRSYRPFLPDALFRTEFENADVDENRTVASSSAPHSVGRSSPMPSPTWHASNLRQPPRLDERRVSLLTVQLKSQDSAVEQPSYSRFYLVRHTASVAAVFDAVKAQRGSFDFFVGDRIHASFNAFNSALNHAVYAMSAASAVKAAVQADAEMYAAVSAVVTGTAYVGNLGTDAVRRPSVVGRLALLAGRMLRAGCLVEEDVVCCTRTRQEARFSHELRALLHTFVLGLAAAEEEDNKAGVSVLLYRLGTENVEAPGVAQEGPQEWMYEIKDQETSGCVEHNRAADVLRREGAEAAVAAMREWGCAADMVARFEADVAGALVVDLRPRCGAIDQLDVRDAWKMGQSVVAEEAGDDVMKV